MNKETKERLIRNSNAFKTHKVKEVSIWKRLFMKKAWNIPTEDSYTKTRCSSNSENTENGGLKVAKLRQNTNEKPR